MKKDGMTLVELMIVVVIIGVLAAISVPQFGNAIARARCAEVPLNLNKISIAQEAYFAEQRKYKSGCYWGYSSNNGKANLGVSITPSAYFQYFTTATNSGNGFNASTYLVKSIGNATGKADRSGPKIQLTESGIVTVVNGTSNDKAALKTYLRSYITD